MGATSSAPSHHIAREAGAAAQTQRGLVRGVGQFGQQLRATLANAANTRASARTMAARCFSSNAIDFFQADCDEARVARERAMNADVCARLGAHLQATGNAGGQLFFVAARVGSD